MEMEREKIRILGEDFEKSQIESAKIERESVGNQTAPPLLDLFLQNQRTGSHLKLIHNYSHYDLNTGPKEGSLFHRTERILITE